MSNSDRSENADPFALIEKGNELESSQDLWGAASKFLNASMILARKADDLNKMGKNKLEQSKVEALYRDQSLIFKHRARRTLIKAMETEQKQDEERADKLPSRVEIASLLLGECDGMNADLSMDMKNAFEPFMHSLDDEAISERRALFQNLFLSWNEEKIDNAESPQNVPENAEVKTLSLEERLALLNSSLPEPKSDDQRIHDLQKSLSGLGVSIPNHNKDDVERLYRESDVSEEDQVQEIMNMARDEVELDGGANSESKDVMELLKQSSIRIDLDRSFDDSTNDDESTNLKKTDAEMEFWKNLEISEDDDNEQPKSQIEQMKQKLVVAQQLLLQASLCLEELEESGFQMEQSEKTSATIPALQVDEEKEEPQPNNGDIDLGDDHKEEGPQTNNGDADVCDEHEKMENKSQQGGDTDVSNEKNGDSLDIESGEEHSKSGQSLADALEANEKNEQKKFIESQEEGINKSSEEITAAAAAATMGKNSLEEARQIVDKLLSMWTN